MPMTEVVRATDDTLPERALKYLGLHPDNPATWVLAALARKYELDPLLNEVAVISTKQGLKPYVTRDGLLTVAHRSGQFDGLTVDELREGEHGWACTVTVWRKDMTHGFTYSAGCGKVEPQAQQGHGAEMALARAERRALHRAFNIPSVGADWEADYALDQGGPLAEGVSAGAVEGATPTVTPRPRPPVHHEDDPIRVLMAEAGIGIPLDDTPEERRRAGDERKAYIEGVVRHALKGTLAELPEMERAMVMGDLKATIAMRQASATPEADAADKAWTDEALGGPQP